MTTCHKILHIKTFNSQNGNEIFVQRWLKVLILNGFQQQVCPCRIPVNELATVQTFLDHFNHSTPQGVLKVLLENVIRDAVTCTEHAKRKSVTAMNVVCTSKRQGRTLYGFGG